MSDKTFLDLLETTLDRIEHTIDSCDSDIDSMRSGSILTLEFGDGSKIVINGQPAMNELWVAAKAGGFHFRHNGDTWRNTRDGSELYAALSRLVSDQAKAPVTLTP